LTPTARAQQAAGDDARDRRREIEQLRAIQRELDAKIQELERQTRLVGRGDRITLPGVFDLSRVPADTVAAVVARPSAVLGRPEYKPVADLLNEPMRAGRGAGTIDIPPEDVDRVVLLFSRPADPRRWGSPLFVISTNKGQDWKAVAGRFVGDPEEVEHRGQVYYRSKKSPVGIVYLTPDDRTFVSGPEDEVLRLLDASASGGPVRHPWDEAWSKAPPGELMAAVDPSWVGSALAGPRGPEGALLAFTPLFDKATGYAASVTLDRGLKIELVATAPSDDAAEEVEATLQALVTLGKNAVANVKRDAGPGRPGPRLRAIDVALLDLAGPLLAGARVARAPGERRHVHIRAVSDVDPADVVRTLSTAAVSARDAAGRAQSANHLKQIGLAMHNYHAANGHFPPAVLKGPDGKTPYSWRVALLPYLDEESLFKQYNFNEPWDSAENRRVLEKMPAVFRHPDDTRPDHFTAYFVPVGSDTIFPPGGAGTKVLEVTDGTSNTLLTVEAKRPVPWTKPEDIDVPPAGDPSVPRLGGFWSPGFYAGFADGSVRFLSQAIAPSVLRAILSRNGGEVISADALNVAEPPPDHPRPPVPPATPSARQQR
jgi:hypothetical protein